MAVLEMLVEVIGAEKLLRLVALTKFVYVVEVLRAELPSRGVGKFFATVAADVCTVAGHGRVEGCLWAGERSTRPGMTSQVEGVLVTLRFVLVFEAVGTVSTAILLFGLVQPGN